MTNCTCLTCGVPLQRNPGAGRPRLYCSNRCRSLSYKQRAIGADAAQVIERWGSTCYLCGEDVTSAGEGPDRMSIDHVIALSRGGTHDIDNLRVVHYACNARKGGRFVCPHCSRPI